LHQDGLKGAHSQAVIDQLFAHLADPKPRITILDSVYKTNYTTIDSYLSVEEGNYPLFYYRSTQATKDAQLSTFLARHKPAGVLNLMGGFSAALLVNAEINGLSAAAIHAIVDSHYITAETLTAFGPFVRDVLGAPFDNI